MSISVYIKDYQCLPFDLPQSKPVQISWTVALVTFSFAGFRHISSPRRLRSIHFNKKIWHSFCLQRTFGFSCTLYLATTFTKDTCKTEIWSFSNHPIPFITSFVGICLVIISEWPSLSHTLLWFCSLESEVTGQFTGLESGGLTCHNNLPVIS